MFLPEPPDFYFRNTIVDTAYQSLLSDLKIIHYLSRMNHLTLLLQSVYVH